MGSTAGGSKDAENYVQFRDALSTALIEKMTKPQQPKKAKRRGRARLDVSKTASAERDIEDKRDGGDPADAGDLAEFTDYIAWLTFSSLPPDLQAMDHHTWADRSDLREQYTLPLTSNDISDNIVPGLDPSIHESLTTYDILKPPDEDVATFLAPVLTSYMSAITVPPPAAWTTRGKITDCEMCGRDWVPLTYHHLIPRFVHAKAVKRGWHREEDLQNVAWLCRACHSFVHRFAGHEELAREFYTVERLLEQEEVQKFAMWVGRVRWKAK